MFRKGNGLSPQERGCTLVRVLDYKLFTDYITEWLHSALTRRNITLKYRSEESNRFSEIALVANGRSYYRRFGITEFGKSVRYYGGDSHLLHEIPDTLMAVCSIPENALTGPESPCDPFKLDVYSLGWIFAEDFLNVSSKASYILCILQSIPVQELPRLRQFGAAHLQHDCTRSELQANDGASPFRF